jgi:hypothetical protein
MKKIIYLLAVLFVLTSCTKNNDKYSHLRHFISFEGGFTSGAEITYNLIGAEAETYEYYINLILPEMARYPDGFFDKMGLGTVAIVRDLRLNNIERAGVAEPENHILFINTGYGYTDSSIKETFHHELSHCTEFFMKRKHTYYWDQWWLLYNASYVGYYDGKGDRHASSDYNPNLSGFLTEYSTQNQDEDKAVMMEFYLSDDYNALFIEKARKDGVFYQKAVLLFTFYKERLDFNLLDEFLLKVNQKNSHLRHYISFERYTSPGVSYDLLEAEKHNYYSNLLLAEMDKYPDGFFD